MGGLRKSLWAIPALVALPAPAFAQDMCAALNRIEAAARETPAFASLAEAGVALVPGYRFCRVETETVAREGRILCHRTLAPKNLEEAVVGPQVRDCLNATAVPRPDPWSPNEYRTASLSITVASHCDERCHVGRIASLTVTIRRREEPAPPAG